MAITEPGGVLVVDKPGRLTSHDVVARVRRLAGTRRVGHAGTLDPMATGVLVLGIGRATRLLGHLAAADKAYVATIRLGVATSTGDAEGEVVATGDPSGLTDGAVGAAMGELTGEVEQVPPATSAIKIGGERAYRRARRGENVELPLRWITVSAFELLDRRGADLDVAVVCSTGTYVRALARDLGGLLGLGGHLTALRRTRVGSFSVQGAHPLDELERKADSGGSLGSAVQPLGDAVAACFPRRDVDAGDAWRVAHGGRLPAAGYRSGPLGVFGPDGQLVALAEESGGETRPLAVFAG
jgi:tRNA pseudouridine55 synthase